MKRVAAAVALSMAFVGAATVVAAQQQASPGDPKVEFGVGAGYFNSGGTMPITDVLIQARAGVRVSGSWSIEGLFDVRPPADFGSYGYYRVQAKWRSRRPGVQPFFAVGGAGELSWYHWKDFQVTDADGNVLWTQTAGSEFHVGLPIYPTVSAGIEKVLASHLAVRAELGVAFGINDYGVSMALLPAVSVSVPIGRYRTSR